MGNHKTPNFHPSNVSALDCFFINELHCIRTHVCVKTSVRGTLEILGNTDAGEHARQILKSLPQSDLTVANLEAPVVSQATLGENKRYKLRTDVSALDLFGSRSVLSLANNHIMDYGEKGLTETIAALNARGIVHAGAGRNLEEASKPALIDVGGVRVAVLCCADPRFQAAAADRAGTCPATIEQVEVSVRELRPTADIVIVSAHMGIEFLPVPSKRQIELAEVCARAGAAVLHFHHTHDQRNPKNRRVHCALRYWQLSVSIPLGGLSPPSVAQNCGLEGRCGA